MLCTAEKKYYNKKALTVSAVRALFVYSDKHINVNIVPIQNSMLFILRKEELFSTISKQRKITGFDVFPNYLFAIAACLVDRSPSEYSCLRFELDKLKVLN